jgi:hypothetical protein
MGRFPDWQREYISVILCMKGSAEVMNVLNSSYLSTQEAEKIQHRVQIFCTNVEIDNGANCINHVGHWPLRTQVCPAIDCTCGVWGHTLHYY